MITMTATIDILKSGTGAGESGTLSALSCNLSGDNVSSGISEIMAVKRRIKRPFILGKSKLGSGDTYTKELDYYMSRQLANAYGVFENPYTITISGTNITAITLAFDDLNNRFPKSIIIDGATYTDDDPKWTIKLDSANTHTVTIGNWNTPNESLILSGIYIDVTIELNKRNMTGIDFSIMERSDTSKPSWGIISNSGTLNFNDIDAEVKDYAEQLLLVDGLDVTILLNDALAGINQVIGRFNTNSWNYDKYNRTVSVNIKDDLEEWQDINVAALNYVPTISLSQSLKYFYEYLYSKTPAKYNMFAFDELDATTKDVLTNTIVQYPYLESKNLWGEWEKLCQASQAYIYKNGKGRTVFLCREGN